jgi:hypothetical protein
VIGNRKPSTVNAQPMLEIIRYLRELAHDCARIARDCPYPRTARVLEELAVDIMAKAKEIEDLYGW